MVDVEKTATAFERFVASGYSHKLFTEALYDVFRNSFGFIAHFDRDGFYSFRFSTAGARVATLTAMLMPSSWVSRQLWEPALRAVVEKRGLLDAAIRERDAEIEKNERAELARLKAKYER